jgi:hypothetical protein
VLLPSDTYREPITSITGVLLPFVTYLLTLPRNNKCNNNHDNNNLLGLGRAYLFRPFEQYIDSPILTVATLYVFRLFLRTAC